MFVHEGLSRGARCLFLGTQEDYETLGRGLEELGICTRRATSRGALQFRSVEEIYVYDGKFDRPARARQDRRADRRGARRRLHRSAPGAELTNVPDQESWRQIVCYEAMINERFARRPIAALCRYPRPAVPPDRVRDVLRTHPAAILRGEILRQPVLRAPRARADATTVHPSSTGSSASCVFTSGPASTSRARRSSAVAAAAELAGELHHLRSGRDRPTKPD